jgi:hypothetical protein
MRCPPTASVASTTPSPGTRTSARSLNATASSPAAPSHSALCCSIVKSNRSSRSSASGSSSGWTSTRNPRLPRVDAEHRHRPPRHQPQRAEHRAVAAEADDSIRSLGQLRVGHDRRVAVPARGVMGSHQQTTAVQGRPNCRRRRAPGRGPGAGAGRARSRVRRPRPAGYRRVSDSIQSVDSSLPRCRDRGHRRGRPAAARDDVQSDGHDPHPHQTRRARTPRPGLIRLAGQFACDFPPNRWGLRRSALRTSTDDGS